MSWAHIQAVRDVIGLTPAGRHVLLALALYSDDRGRAWPAATTLADWTGLHRSSVLRQLRLIVKHTPVTVIHRTGRASVFDLDKLPQRAPSKTGSARPVTPKRAPSPHRISSKELIMCDAAPPRDAAAPHRDTTWRPDMRPVAARLEPGDGGYLYVVKEERA